MFIVLCLFVLNVCIQTRKQVSLEILKSEPLLKYEQVGQAEESQQKYIIKGDFFKKRIRTDISQKFPEWGSAQEDSTLITITKDSLVILNNQDKDQYKLNNLLGEAQGINEFDGDKWFGVQWVATDDAGKQTVLIFQKYISKTIAITIRYGNIEYKYQGRQLKEKYKQII